MKAVKETTPHAFYFKNLAFYNKDNMTNINQVIIFEYLVMLGKLYHVSRKKRTFYHSIKQFREHTLLADHSISKQLNAFEKLGLLHKTRKGLPATGCYSVDFCWLVNNLEYFFNKDGVELYRKYFRSLCK